MELVNNHGMDNITTKDTLVATQLTTETIKKFNMITIIEITLMNHEHS